MNKTPVSKSQVRLLDLAGLSANDYAEASQVLESAGFNGDGCPFGQTWREAAKLTDNELLAKAVTLDGPRYRMSDVEIAEVGY